MLAFLATKNIQFFSQLSCISMYESVVKLWNHERSHFVNKNLEANNTQLGVNNL